MQRAFDIASLKVTVIGAALAFVGAVVMGIFGFIWYPLKRLFRALTRKGTPDQDREEA